MGLLLPRIPLSLETKARQTTDQTEAVLSFDGYATNSMLRNYCSIYSLHCSLGEMISSILLTMQVLVRTSTTRIVDACMRKSDLGMIL